MLKEENCFGWGPNFAIGDLLICSHSWQLGMGSMGNGVLEFQILFIRFGLIKLTFAVTVNIFQVNMVEKISDLLVFVVEKRHFAIHLEPVERVIRAVAVTKPVDSPGFIEGVIDFYGEIIPVINMRLRFSFPLQNLRLSDKFIIVSTSKRKLALIVDEVENVISPESQDLFDSKDIIKGLKYINILRHDDGIIFIYDLESLLETSEEIQLERFLKDNF